MVIEVIFKWKTDESKSNTSVYFFNAGRAGERRSYQHEEDGLVIRWLLGPAGRHSIVSDYLSFDCHWSLRAVIQLLFLLILPIDLM
jgi:hypothetical protein